MQHVHSVYRYFIQLFTQIFLKNHRQTSFWPHMFTVIIYHTVELLFRPTLTQLTFFVCVHCQEQYVNPALAPTWCSLCVFSVSYLLFFPHKQIELACGEMCFVNKNAMHLPLYRGWTHTTVNENVSVHSCGRCGMSETETCKGWLLQLTGTQLLLFTFK